MRNRFVVPATVRYNLSDDEWIEVKKELNAGEERKLASIAMVPTPFVDPQTGKARVIDRIDWSLWDLMKAELWMTAWHLHDVTGNVPPLTLDSLKALDVPTFSEITKIIDRHSVESVAAKKGTASPSGTKSDQTSS